MKFIDMKGLNHFLICGIVSLFFLSCESNTNTSDNVANVESIPSVSLTEHLKMDTNEVRMFTMPTPLQVATSLKMMHVDVNNSFLLPHHISYKSDVDQALGLGAYIVNLGFTTVYNNYQESINYAQDVQQLMEELNISYYLNDDFITRFKNNATNQDSLSKLILKSYSDAHSYFNQDEGLGLLILTGAYIEGIYQASNFFEHRNWKEQHDVMLIQQKLFLDNFILLLNAYTQHSKIKKLVNDLQGLKLVFEEVEIYSDPNNNGDYVLQKKIDYSTKTKLKEAIGKLRNKLLITS